MSIDEELPAGQMIVVVMATDRDKPNTLNSDIVYSIADVFVTSDNVDPVSFQYLSFSFCLISLFVIIV